MTEQKIFDMVARRFIAVFYPAAQFELTTRITRVEGEAFKTEGKIIVDPGWLAVYGRRPETDGESDKAIVPITAGRNRAQTEGDRDQGERHQAAGALLRKPPCSAPWKARANSWTTRSCAKR